MIEPKYIPGTTCKCLLDQYVTYNLILPQSVPRVERYGGRSKIYGKFLASFNRPQLTIPYFESLLSSEIKDELTNSINKALGPFASSTVSSKILLFKNSGSYCIDCLQAYTSYINQQLITEEYCKIHNKKLISVCPKCGNEFDYNVNIGTKNPYRCKTYCCDYKLAEVEPWDLIVRINKELEDKNYLKYENNVSYPNERGYISIFQGSTIKSDYITNLLKTYLNTGLRPEPTFIVKKDDVLKINIRKKIIKYIKQHFRTNVSKKNLYDILNDFEANNNPELLAAALLIRKAFDYQSLGMTLISGTTIQNNLINTIKDSGIQNYSPIVDKLLDMYIEDFYKTSVDLFKLYKCNMHHFIHSDEDPIEVGYEIVVIESENSFETYGCLIPPLEIKSLRG